MQDLQDQKKVNEKFIIFTMIRKFNTRLLFIDTDSLCYEIHGKKHEKMYK